MKKVVIAAAVGTLMLAGNAWAEGCAYSSHAKGKKMQTAELIAQAPTDAKDLLLWKMRGLDDAKRSRLLEKAPIESIVPIHN